MVGRFKAVGFDMDGTFLRTHVDYDRLNNVDREVLARHGVPFDEIDFEGRAKRLRTPIRRWLEAIGGIRAKGLKVGILTRGSLQYAKRALGPAFDDFDAVMGRDYSFYDDAKPSPVAMVQFASLLGVDPSEILYVGDNISDWQSAVGAGAVFVGVLTGSCTEAEWLDADPDMIVVDRAGDVVELLR